MSARKMSNAQRAVWNAMGDDGRVFYYPPIHMGPGRFDVGRTRELASYGVLGRSIPYTTIRAMANAGLLVEVRRFDVTATSTGRNAGVEYRRAPAPPETETPRP